LRKSATLDQVSRVWAFTAKGAKEEKTKISPRRRRDAEKNGRGESGP
jgi:hypothetical protein